MSLARDIAVSIKHLLLPRLCEGCSIPLILQEHTLCMSCIAQLPQTGFHHIPNNDAALRLAGRVPFKYATAYAYFTPEGLLQHLLHGLKYKSKKHIGIFLGKQAAYALKETAWISEIDALVPIPLHRKKLAARGYNQSQEIARGISDVLGKPLLTHCLVRERNTESQTRKTREERVLNVSNAFRYKGTSLVGVKHVLLVDDVLTTGATLEAASSAILKDSTVSVSILSIGLAVS